MKRLYVIVFLVIAATAALGLAIALRALMSAGILQIRI